MRVTAAMLATALVAVAVWLASAAAAEPVWPVAGDDSASTTIDELQAQGYNVAINWVSGVSTVALSRCKVTAIHNPDRSPSSENTFTTVYVDVACPNPGDGWGWGGVGVGVGF